MWCRCVLLACLTALGVKASCISQPLYIFEGTIGRNFSESDVEELISETCQAGGDLCRPQEKANMLNLLMDRVREYNETENTTHIRLILDRTGKTELKYANTSSIMKLAPGVDPAILCALHCMRLGLERESTEGAALYRLIRSKALELTDVCGYDLELNERRALANATSPVLSPYHVQAVLAHLSDPSSGYAVDVAKLSEDHVYWELVSPRNGSEVDASGQVPLTVVLKAGGVELPLEKAEAIFGINIMAVIMLDDANLRLMPVQAAARATLSGMLGMHSCAYQLLDEHDYPLSFLMTTTFRKGAFLKHLEAPLQTQAYYSLYPERLFQRAQVLEQHQRHREAVNSFVVALRHTGWDHVPPSPTPLTPLPSPTPGRPWRFLSFHTMQGGLNNQVMELAGMVAIANALDRVLVAPALFSTDFVGQFHVLGLDRLLDLRAFQTNLAGYMRLYSEELHGPLPPELHIEMSEHFAERLDVDYFRDLLGGPTHADVQHIKLSGGYGCFNAERGPMVRRQVMHSLVFSADVLGAADCVTQALLGHSQGGGYLAVHPRVEVDWLDYARRREVAAEGHVAFWFDAQDVASRVAATPRLRPFHVVYVAVGAGMVQDARAILQAELASSRGGQEGARVVAFTKGDLCPHTRALPYSLQSAVDMLVCERAAAFVGTSYSSFSNAVARRHHELGKASYIYNLPGAQTVLERTDGGELLEPLDVTTLPVATYERRRPEEDLRAASPPPPPPIPSHVKLLEAPSAPTPPSQSIGQRNASECGKGDAHMLYGALEPPLPALCTEFTESAI